MSMVLSTTLKLAVVAGISAAILTLAVKLTAAPIAEQERQRRIEALSRLVSPDTYDNEPWNDAIVIDDTDLIGYKRPMRIARLAKGGLVTGTIIPVRAKDGYSGAIDLAIFVDPTGVLRGVRVISHHETPGIGDKIERERSDWMTQFENADLDSPPEKSWAVSPGPGRTAPAFDAISNATITSQAVVKGLRRALQFYRDNKSRLITVTDDEP